MLPLLQCHHIVPVQWCSVSFLCLMQWCCLEKNQLCTKVVKFIFYPGKLDLGLDFYLPASTSTISAKTLIVFVTPIRWSPDQFSSSRTSSSDFLAQCLTLPSIGAPVSSPSWERAHKRFWLKLIRMSVWQKSLVKFLALQSDADCNILFWFISGCFARAPA